MTLRSTIGAQLESAIGKPRMRELRRRERRARRKAAAWVQGPAQPPKPEKPSHRKTPDELASKPPTGWRPAEPFVPHPQPEQTRHQLLRMLHQELQPRTYFEIGVSTGRSMRVSRTRSIGVDPAFQVITELHCDIQLVRDTSDDFFARPDAFSHFGGTPIDLAFIDGMHLAEFALRDFINVERHMARTGVVVFDDVLPRNPLEAARDRRTRFWAGDVYKTLEVLRRRRPDLLVVTVNTAPTGTAIVVGLDPDNRTLTDTLTDDLAYCTSPDPQQVPARYLDRRDSVTPAQIAATGALEQLRELREHPDPESVQAVVAKLRDALAG